jgi:hypothetical protein
MPSSDSTSALADQAHQLIAEEAVQRRPSAWSECRTTDLVDGVLTVVPLSAERIEWLDRHFPDGP